MDLHSSALPKSRAAFFASLAKAAGVSVLSAFLLSLAPATGFAQTTLKPIVNTPGALRAHDPELGFNFEIPAGYEVFKPTNKPPNQRHSYIKMVEGSPNWVLLVSTLGKPMAKVRLQADQIPPGSGITLADFQWRGLEVNAFRKPEKYDDQDYVTFNVQIPLKEQAIQISFGGPAKEEAALRSMAEKFLSTLDGETNW